VLGVLRRLCLTAATAALGGGLRLHWFAAKAVFISTAGTQVDRPPARKGEQHSKKKDYDRHSANLGEGLEAQPLPTLSTTQSPRNPILEIQTAPGAE